MASAAPIETLVNYSLRQANLHLNDAANVAGFSANGGFVHYNGFGAPNMKNMGASALIHSDVYHNVAGPLALSSIEPSGWNQIGVTGNLRHRCHLIPRQLSGSGKDARNMFTCHSYANTPVIKYYEDRVAALVATFPTTGPWAPDKCVNHIVSLNYVDGQDWPDTINMRSEFWMSGVFHEVLLNLVIVNKDRFNTHVTFLCIGTFGQPVPPSLVKTGQFTTTTTPC